MSPRVRISVVGLGFMGGRWARAVAEHPGAVLARVCDVDEQAAKRAASELGCAWSTDPDDSVTGDVQGVVVCTPEHLHKDVAVHAIEAGCAVAVEKPLAHAVSHATQIRDAARSHDAPVLAGHILRFEPRYAAMHTAVRQGRIGTVQAVRSERIGLVDDQEVLRGRTSLPLYYGVHELDLARWYAGEIDSIVATRTSGVLHAAGYDIHDTYAMLLRFTGGAQGTSMIGWTLPGSAAATGLSGFTVLGEHGFLRVDQGAVGLVGFDESGAIASDTWYSPDVHGRLGGALANEVGHFVDIVRGDAEPLCGADDGLEAVRCSLAAEVSATEGRPARPNELGSYEST